MLYLNKLNILYSYIIDKNCMSGKEGKDVLYIS